MSATTAQCHALNPRTAAKWPNGCPEATPDGYKVCPACTGAYGGKKRGEKKRPPFDELPLLAWVVAETVCGEPYTQQELGPMLRDPDSEMCRRVERRRGALTKERIAEFGQAFETLCRAAYAVRADWFEKCVRAKDNAGRDRLYVYARHNMAAWLLTGRLPGQVRT